MNSQRLSEKLHEVFEDCIQLAYIKKFNIPEERLGLFKNGFSGIWCKVFDEVCGTSRVVVGEYKKSREKLLNLIVLSSLCVLKIDDKIDTVKEVDKNQLNMF
jgi:hypothetical protein